MTTIVTPATRESRTHSNPRLLDGWPSMDGGTYRRYACLRGAKTARWHPTQPMVSTAEGLSATKLWVITDRPAAGGLGSGCWLSSQLAVCHELYISFSAGTARLSSCNVPLQLTAVADFAHCCKFTVFAPRWCCALQLVTRPASLLRVCGVVLGAASRHFARGAGGHAGAMAGTPMARKRQDWPHSDT